jgi:hypothetical protein
MEIKSDVIIDLVAGQGRIEQALTDMGKRFDAALPYMNNQHLKLADRVTKVENKQWYISGLGTAIGAVIGYAVTWFKK